MQAYNITPISPLRLLVYGKPGNGKTTLFGTAGLDDRSAPVLWIDAGGNPIVLSRLKLKPGAIRVLRINAIGDLTDAYNWIVEGQPAKGYFAQTHGLTPPYRSLVFDGITHIQRLSFDAITGGEDSAPGLIPPVPAWQHYRSVLGQMINIASKFYTLPMHVMMSALQHPDQRYLVPGDPKTQYIYNEPLLAGQSVDELPGWALNVGRIALASTYDPQIVKAITPRNAIIEDHKPIIQFKPTRYVDAKDQHGLGDYIANPSIKMFLDTIASKADAPASKGDQ